MHPLAAPGTLWVLSSDGKYLVRPQADETSHKEQISCARQGKGPTFFFPYRKGFRLCGGDQRAFRSPFGNLRVPLQQKGVREEQLFCGRQGKGPSLLEGFRLCGGDQRAFRSPFGNLRRPPFEADGSHKKQISCGGQGKRAFLSFFCFSGAFASAEATRGLSGRPPGPLRGISISDRALPIGCFYAYWPKNTKTTNQPPLPHFLHYFGKDIDTAGIHLSCPGEIRKE